MVEPGWRVENDLPVGSYGFCLRVSPPVEQPGQCFLDVLGRDSGMEEIAIQVHNASLHCSYPAATDSRPDNWAASLGTGEIFEPGGVEQPEQ